MVKLGKAAIITSVVLLVSLVAVGAGFAKALHPSSQKLTKIVIGTGGSSVNAAFAQAYVAAQQGFFKAQGLDVTIQPFGAGLAGALVSGQADFAVVGTGAAAALTQNGQPTQLIYGQSGGGLGGAVVAAKPSIKTIQDCASVMTTSVGTTSYAWALFDEQFFKTNYSIRVGDPSTFGPAVVAGAADCAVGAYTQLDPLVQSQRAHYVFDPLRKPPAGFYASKAYEGEFFALTSRLKQLGTPTVIGFIKALDKAWLPMVQTYSTDKLAQLVFTYPVGSQPIPETQIAASLALTRKSYSPNRGFITKSSWDITRRFFRQAGYGYLSPTNSKFKYGTFVNMSYYIKALGDPTKKK